MLSFEYKGYDADGRPVRGLVEAPDAKSARATLAARGVLCHLLRPAAAARAHRRRADAFADPARAMFYRELSALLLAGTPLVPALEIILATPELASARVLLAAARDAVRDGRPLSDALPAACPLVTPFERAVLLAGERSGGMPAALSRLAAFLEDQSRLRDSVLSALAYPLVVLLLACLVGGLVMTFLLPMMRDLLAEAALPLPFFSRALLSSARVLGPLLLAVFVLALAALVFGRRTSARATALRASMERRLLALPFFGPLWMNLLSLRFARVLALLLEREIPLLDALPLAGSASGSPALAESARLRSLDLAQGAPIADVVRSMHPLDPSLSAWIRAGQSSGNLSPLVDAAAERLRHLWDRRTARALMLLEILLTLAVGALVTLLALSILLPVLRMNQGFAS